MVQFISEDLGQNSAEDYSHDPTRERVAFAPRVGYVLSKNLSGF